jgi:type IV pilus assembly protein PilM
LPSNRKSGPTLACEITTDHVVAGRLAESGNIVEFYTARELPVGALRPSLSAPNVQDRDALRSAIAAALSAVGGHARDVAVVLPDAAVRVALLDFESLPQRANELAPLIRFRLKKSVPFDVEQAALSYQVDRNSALTTVIAAAAPRAVIDEYESLFRDEAYEPGVMLPSVLANLGVLSGDYPALMVHTDTRSVSVAGVSGGHLRLVRSLENPVGAALTGELLAGEVYPSLVFFEDTFSAKIERVYYSGSIPLPQVAHALQEHAGARVEALVPPELIGGNISRESTARALLGGVAGALLA